MALLAIPEKRVVMPGQEPMNVGISLIGGKTSLIIAIEGQAQRIVPIGYDGAVQLASALLATAIQEQKAKGELSNGQIFQPDEPRKIIG